MNYHPPEFLNTLQRYALGAGLAAFALSVIGAFIEPVQFFQSYLVSLVFWISIALGALFLTLLHHLTGAKWSVVLRRFFENIMTLIPWLALLFIPLFFGLSHLYEWSHSPLHDELLAHKSPYLNVRFFILRNVLYFCIWSALAMALYRASRRQDVGGTGQPFVRLSAPGVILSALTVTFAAFDWLMSTEAHWYSTIFGVYFFGASTLAAIAVVTLTALFFRRRNMLRDAITASHYHDLGKLLFTFTIFWAYIAFSQYFLIWYANIPEETVWYAHRWTGSWKSVSLLLVFGHFIVPFFTLMTRAAKSHLSFLTLISLWLLAMHWLDLHWIVSPVFHPDGLSLSWLDFTTLLAVGGCAVAALARRFGAAPLIPINDPNLSETSHA